jgi:hypothetical protein
MNNQIPNNQNNPSYTGGTAEKAAKYEAARERTLRKKAEIKANLDFHNDIKARKEATEEVTNWFAEKGITQESLESDVAELLMELKIDPNGISSEDFATFVAQGGFTFKNEFSDNLTTGYESASDLEDFIQDVDRFKQLHTKMMSETDTEIDTLELKKLEDRINDRSRKMIEYIQRIESSEYGKLTLFSKELPFVDTPTALGNYNEHLYDAPKMQIGLTEDGSQITITRESEDV